jgi:hypothetical protein
MRIPLIAATLLLSVAAHAGAPPAYDSYAVAPDIPVRSAPVRLDSAESKRYAAMLREGARQKANFAGHYVLTSWGCGASCTMSAAIDAKTGTVAWLPFTVCCWDLDITEPLEFKIDSRLLVVHGSRNEKGGGTYFYEFDGKHFRLISAVEKPAK